MSATGRVVVAFGAQSHVLAEGGRLPFGRAADRPLRVDDPRVSRRAGVVFVQGGCAWVRNDSTRHGLGVRAADRPVRHLRRRLPDQPYPLQEPLLGRDPVVELLGSAGTLSITVDTGRLMAPDHRSAPDLDVLDQTVTETVALDDDQKRLLAYLIGPLLRGGGTGRIRTTRELALECNETKAKVERRLAALRQRLYEQGVPGLWPDEYLDPAASLAPTVNYVERLGEYAYFHGWANLSDLPPGRPLL